MLNMRLDSFGKNRRPNMPCLTQAIVLVSAVLFKRVHLPRGSEWAAETEMGTPATRLLKHAPSFPFPLYEGESKSSRNFSENYLFT